MLNSILRKEINMSTTCTGPQLFINLRDDFKKAAKNYLTQKELNPTIVESTKQAADTTAFSILNNDHNSEQRRLKLAEIAHDDELLRSLVKPVVQKQFFLSDISDDTLLKNELTHTQYDFSRFNKVLKERFDIELEKPCKFGQLLSFIKEKLLKRFD